MTAPEASRIRTPPGTGTMPSPNTLPREPMKWGRSTASLSRMRELTPMLIAPFALPKATFQRARLVAVFRGGGAKGAALVQDDEAHRLQIVLARIGESGGDDFLRLVQSQHGFSTRQRPAKSAPCALAKSGERAKLWAAVTRPRRRPGPPAYSRSASGSPFAACRSPGPKGRSWRGRSRPARGPARYRPR